MFERVVQNFDGTYSITKGRTSKYWWDKNDDYWWYLYPCHRSRFRTEEEAITAFKKRKGRYI